MGFAATHPLLLGSAPLPMSEDGPAGPPGPAYRAGSSRVCIAGASDGPRRACSSRAACSPARPRDHEGCGRGERASPLERCAGRARWGDGYADRFTDIHDRSSRQLPQGHGISFRFSSQPAPEAIPAVASRRPAGRTRGGDAGARSSAAGPAIACFPRGSKVSLPALLNELGVEVIAGRPRRFAGALLRRRAARSRPWAGQWGRSPSWTSGWRRWERSCFAPSPRSDWFEIPFDAFARVEQPKLGCICGRRRAVDGCA